jgi:hypothetical protein
MGVQSKGTGMAVVSGLHGEIKPLCPMRTDVNAAR